MVVQMKRDKERGAEDIETFGHICEGFGAIFFSIFGGHIITKYEKGSPFFYLTFFSGLTLIIASLIYPTLSEDGNLQNTNHVSSAKDKVLMIKQFLKVHEIKNTLIFFFVVSIISPNFEEFFVYFNEEVHHMKPIFDGYASIALFVVFTVLLVLYNYVLMKKYDLGFFVLTASGFRIASALLFAYQVSALKLNARAWLLV